MLRTSDKCRVAEDGRHGRNVAAITSLSFVSPPGFVITISSCRSRRSCAASRQGQTNWDVAVGPFSSRARSNHAVSAQGIQKIPRASSRPRDSDSGRPNVLACTELSQGPASLGENPPLLLRPTVVAAVGVALGLEARALVRLVVLGRPLALGRPVLGVPGPIGLGLRVRVSGGR